MKTNKQKFSSPKHLLKILVRVHENKKDLLFRDSYEDNENAFYIDLHDEFIDDEIEKLELRLLGIKQKINKKNIKYP